MRNEQCDLYVFHQGVCEELSLWDHLDSHFWSTSLRSIHDKLSTSLHSVDNKWTHLGQTVVQQSTEQIIRGTSPIKGGFIHEFYSV